jgi:hypothetical protein
MFNRDDILNDLRDNVAEVTFFKVDGTKRTLKCTLRGDLLPPRYDEHHMMAEHKKEGNEKILVVWDMDAKAWKSFHVENVQLVQFLNNF